MIKSIAAVLMATSVPGALAQTDNVVGLWERLPVMAADQVVAVPSLLFTNRKLDHPATFTGLQQAAGHLRVLCCVEVRNATPLKVSDLVKRYGADPDFAEHIKSIKGLAYVYEAVPVDKRDWNEFMKNSMRLADDPTMATPFSVPVVAGSLGKVARVEKRFRIGDKEHELAVTYEKPAARVRYTYRSGSETVVFSEATPGGD